MHRLTPCLWFDTQAEDAAKYYTSIFKNSKLGTISRYGEAGPRPKGMALMVEFELDGQPFTALNGGPQFKFTEAVSFQVACKDQEEVDWQIVPTALPKLLNDRDPARAKRAMQAMLRMKKIDIATVERAARGT